MPGPKSLPKGGLAATPPANGVDVEKALAEDDETEAATAASVPEDDARYFAPGETVS